MPADADQLIFERRIYKHHAEIFRRQPNSSVKIRMRLLDANSGRALATFDEVTLPELENETRLSERVSMSLSGFAGKRVGLSPEVEGLKNTPSTVLGLHHIYIVTNEPAYANLAPNANPKTSSSQGLANTFSLAQNYPNPFNPTTTIRYTLPGPSEVRLTIYNLVGEEVHSLVVGSRPAGEFTEIWDGKDNFGNEVSSRVYAYQLEAVTTSGQRWVMTRKMLLIR